MPTSSIAIPSKIYPNFEFWFENKPSGNPDATSINITAARWYIFNPKIPIWVYVGMEMVGTFWGHLEYIAAIWYILWQFGNLVAIWYVVSRKIWQP
jgi:hypothetical protein